MEPAKLLGLGAKGYSSGAGYGSAPRHLHIPWEATLWTENASPGLAVLMLSGYEIGHGSQTSLIPHPQS